MSPRLPWNKSQHVSFILGIKDERKKKVEILDIAGLPSIYTLLRQHHLRWLGLVHRMKDDIIPKDFFYEELAESERPTGRPLLRYSEI